MQNPRLLKRYEVLYLFRKYNYEIVSHRKDEIVGTRRGDSVRVFLNTNIVATTIDHPLWGRNTLMRKEIGYYQLDRVLNNPRIHTAKGYRNSPLLCKTCGSKRCYCPVGDPHYFCDHEVWQHRSPPGTPKKKKKNRFVKLGLLWQDGKPGDWVQKPNGKWKKIKAPDGDK